MPTCFFYLVNADDLPVVGACYVLSQNKNSKPGSMDFRAAGRNA